MSKEIYCPRCGNKTLYAPENEYRPFCSERCQMIDLGTWADEGYKVPSHESGKEPIDGDDNNESRREDLH